MFCPGSSKKNQSKLNGGWNVIFSLAAQEKL
jgi:hypothetical protein